MTLAKAFVTGTVVKNPEKRFTQNDMAIAGFTLNIDKNNEQLPYLLKYYKQHYKLSDLSDDLTKRYNNENNLNEEQNELLRKEVFSND